MELEGESPRVNTQSPRQRIADNLYHNAHVERSPPKAHGRGRSSGGRPTFLVCYLCGQQFGTQSLRIHQPQCYVKMLLIWERSPASTRGPKPRDPESAEIAQPSAAAIHNDPAAMERFNEAQFTKWTDEALVPCENCGRTFLPDRLVVHKRSCRAGSKTASKPVAARVRQSVDLSDTASKITEAKMKHDEEVRSPVEDDTKQMPVDVQPVQDAEEDVVKDEVPTDEAAPVVAQETAAVSQPKAAAAHPAVMPLSLRPQKGPELVKCTFCSRNFASNRIEYHQSVCVERRTVALTPRRGARKPTDSPEPQPLPPAVQERTKESKEAAQRKKFSGRPLSSSFSSADSFPRAHAASATKRVDPHTKILSQHQSPAAETKGTTKMARTPGAAPPNVQSPTTPIQQQAIDRSVTPVELQQQRLSELENDLKMFDEKTTHRRARTPSQDTTQYPAHDEDLNVGDLDADEETPTSVLQAPPSTTSTLVQPSPMAPVTSQRQPPSTESRKSVVNYCPECGTKLFIARQKFCHECGSRLPK